VKQHAKHSSHSTFLRRLKAGLASGVFCLLPLSAPVRADNLVNFMQYIGFDPNNHMLKGPDCLGVAPILFITAGAAGCPPGTHEDWLSFLRTYRTMRLSYIAYDDSRYRLSALKWTQSSFMQPQMMVEDRYLYDPVAGKYTVDRYLDDLDQRFGGIDSVLVWPGYPNMGIDSRNQFDMIASMPGGLRGVAQMVADFHRRGVRVLFPMTLWDEGTRDPGKSMPQAVAELMSTLGADGVNGDTMDGVALPFSTSAEALGHPLAFEPERTAPDEALPWNVMSWWGGEDFAKFVPLVNTQKWLESRHMVNISDRWNRSRIDDLQVAFFNGIGVETWENIFGSWNGITAHDGEAIRRVATLARALADYLNSPDWEPFYPTEQFGVFASRWPRGDKTVWTIVNRNDYELAGKQLAVPYKAGERYFDLYAGAELEARREGDRVLLSFPIEGRGVRAVMAASGDLDSAGAALLARMRAMTAKPLAAWSNDWHVLPQHIVAVAAGKRYRTAPQGMVEIPAGSFDFTVHGIEREGANDPVVDVSYPWEDTPRRFHEHRMTVARFFIDRYPVTNTQFKAFIDATHYHPRDDLNFLKDWSGGTFPLGWDNKPVTWVSLEDARAYAAWAGKRLPHEWEWQYAAQGSDARLYPWGNDWGDKNVPLPDKGRDLRGPDAVDAHPGGASPFGVMDLVGNIWQWTEEFADEHTRAAILRGGSYYQPQATLGFFYFPQAYRNDQHGKLLLMAPSRDRSGTVGFRCVADAAD
jgi:gamma-glutamyl hercynylcysteine S-oxide synthase